jgi:hypothetical protein
MLPNWKRRMRLEISTSDQQLSFRIMIWIFQVSYGPESEIEIREAANKEAAN